MQTPQPASSRDELIMTHYPMVRRVAYRMARRLPRHVDVEDLVNIGMIGLIDAVDRFQADRAASFTAYARIRVQGAIVDEMRRNDWVPRSVRDRSARIDHARKDLSKTLGRMPTHEELAAHMEISVERLEELLRTADVRVLVSMEDGNDDENTIGDSLTDKEQNIDEDLTRQLFGQKIRSVLHLLPERERVIVEMYYYRDFTFKEIAHVLGVTESRVSQLHSRMKRRVREQVMDLVSDDML